MSTKSMVYAYTKSEERKPTLLRTTMPPLLDDKVTLTNFHKFVNWPQALGLLFTPLIAIYGMFTTELQQKTYYLSIFVLLFGGLGITAGYHRHFAHRAYSTTTPLKILLICAGSTAIQGSIYWWARGHRAHHRWTDTDKDPYCAHRGFFFSHFGWMLVARPKSRIGYADVADLKADPLIQFQHRNYVMFAAVFGILLPTLVAGFGWGDFRGGFFYAAITRLVISHHGTFCINSLAHYTGEDTFDDRLTPRDYWLTAMITFGEGYHNFHHAFPQDYRNAIRWYQYDPTKWLILTFAFFGLAFDLKTFPEPEIRKSVVQMKEKKIMAERQQLKFGTPLEELPIYTWDEYQALVLDDKKKWVLIEGILYDVESFMHEHPGGVKHLSMAVGKDMTAAFNGGVYNHSNGARNLLTTFRCGVLKNGMQVMTEEQALQDIYADQASLEIKNKSQ